ncbi:MAG: glycogen/starch/alpha-glucan phosphorylase [Gemmataceae bacterium]|nr:glycogen/starch/alpha-glucan phosphorylase [Gemmataceae bacterium]
MSQGSKDRRVDIHDVRTGNSVADFKQAFQDNLHFLLARFPAVATRNDNYMALAYTVRDRMLRRWVATAHTYYEKASRTVCYLSAEYLLGPHLGNNLLNLGLTDTARQAMKELGFDLDDLIDQEEEPGLGNGGLGRLAACYLDSLATTQIPAIGYGIRYEFGIFDQAIKDGAQVEITDKWLRFGNPWEIHRPEIAFRVGFGGTTKSCRDAAGIDRVTWTPDRYVMGVAYDTPIMGFRVNTVNLLRLWQAQAAESFDFQSFNAGDYFGAVNDKIVSENITKVLYPNDSAMQGKVLRLQQQYFFASCALQDIIRMFGQRSKGLAGLPDKFTAQLNDTHPSIAVAELMRLLVDVYCVDWDSAWDMTRQFFAYTNHTLLPEALEVWPLEMFAQLLPRHLQIIFEINRRFLDQVRAKFPGDEDRVRRMSLIGETGGRSVRMAHLATVGSHTVNGVAELHSRLLREQVLHDFAELEPGKFRNVTNGVTPRRFVALANPHLSGLITKAIGDKWIGDLDDLRRLETFAEDAGFRKEWRAARRAAKNGLIAMGKERAGVATDPDSLFDVQAKRFHEYKRQHLNILHVIAQYLWIHDNPGVALVPRTFVFGGKAAPGYMMAKLIIRLINGVAEVVNSDKVVDGRIRVLFVPDYNVKTAQYVYPAADLSEQISTAGKEASGTGNMKFALNGSLTIGTLDGANIEIRDAVGEENFFCFGLTTEEVAAWQSRGYAPRGFLEQHAELTRVLDTIAGGLFGRGDENLYQPLVDNLRNHDPYFVLADYPSYAACQARVSQAFRDVEQWTRMSILNVARMGRFSSDRSIRDYCRDIWKVKPVPIEVG